MKKLTLIAALVIITLVACSKKEGVLTQPNATPNSYFSRVQFFTDGRKPATDTVWTLKLIDQSMVNAYKGQDGYIYASTSTYVERGVLWSK